MALLKIPLSINSEGFFVRNNSENYLAARIKIFVLSGASKFMILPSPGISTLWQQLVTIGTTSKFCGKDVFPENERYKLEMIIKNEINDWIQEFEEEILHVSIVGDDQEPNGIAFRTIESEYKYSIEFVKIKDRKNDNFIGNWRIREKINVIN
jgi:hypothetical protein